ncbi:MAG: hypothetical protein ACAH21_00725 [Ramlibacter sp.]|nr:hypothetical protein [Ramlibacter sp.]
MQTEPRSTPNAADAASWWAILGAAALSQIDPSLVEVAELSVMVAGSTSRAAAQESMLQLRSKAAALRGGLAPLSARALARVVRSAEHASGQVIEKKVRMRVLRERWQDLMVCLHLARH